MSCSYSQERKVLTVKVNLADAEIRRAGDQIVVSEPRGPQKFCDGDTPTVRNTDTIRIVFEATASVRLWLRNGPLAPGATAERKGVSEIEVVGSGSDGAIDVVGLRGADAWEWGTDAEQPGLNLNPESSGDHDVDVTVTGPEVFIAALGRGGDDRVGAGSGPDLPADATGVVDGDAGDDVLHAPSGARGEIDGGAGDDRIFGGPRPDEIHGSASDDAIDVRDDTRDTVDRGDGRDRVRADRVDVLRNCERVIYRSRPAGAA